MSLTFTESFIAFGRYNGSDAFDATPGAANEARANFALALQRAGYTTFLPTNAAADTSGGFVVRPDPLYPERNVLCHSSAVGAAVNAGVTAAFRKEMPITDNQIIVGFSIFIPVDYVPNNSVSTVPVFRMNAGLKATAAWQAIGVVLASALECFRISNDLSIRWNTETAQSSRKLRVGQLNYIEVRIDPTQVNVWIDDTLVMIKQVSLIPQTVSFIFENNVNAGVGGTNMSGTPGRWAIGNMYWMLVDGQAPQQRLGPTTRVIGTRPGEDIDVRFVRPASADSNWSVAAQDIVDSPSQQLQSTTVGDFDTYGTTDVASKDAIRTMGMVHAVATKVLAANLEADIHKIKPYVKYNLSGEGADAKSREFAIISGLPFARTIRAMGVQPGTNCIFICGDGEMIYRSNPNYDISQWTKISDTGTARNFLAMWFRSDGGVLFVGSPLLGGSNAGLLSWLNPGTDILSTPATGGTGTQTPGAIGFALSPDGSRLYAYQGPGANSGWTNWAAAGVFNGATPHQGTWTLLSAGIVPAATNGFQKIVGKPDGSAFLLLAGDSRDHVFTNSNALLSAWTNRPTGDAAQLWSAAIWDGTAWLIGANISGGTNGAPFIRRAADGSTWTPATGFGNSTAGANQALRGAASNRATQETIFFGDGGAMCMSMDGINWRQLPRITTQPLYDGLVLPNGDFLIGGGAGVMIRTQKPGTDVSLQPLAGYSMAFGSAIFNPATAAPWTPAEAADSLFGVRLTT